jgi:hypothetical protein
MLARNPQGYDISPRMWRERRRGLRQRVESLECRKLPWFIDPIEGRLKIERNALLSAYFNRQVEAERNCDL